MDDPVAFVDAAGKTLFTTEGAEWLKSEMEKQKASGPSYGEPAVALYAPPSPRAWPTKEEGVDEILKDYRGYINPRAGLMSLLYDIDMLPEQCVTRVGAIRLAGLCEVWKLKEAAEAALTQAPACS